MVDHGAKKLLKGALVLTLAGLVSKVLSASYRIPLQNLTGDLGFYIYQQVYPILGTVIVLSLYGFPQAISKAASNLGDKQKSISIRNFAIPILSLLFLISFSLFLFMYFNAEAIARWVGDPYLEMSYQMTSFTFLFIPFLSLFRGVLQGRGEMEPTAYSQIGEQLFRVFVIVCAAIFVSFYGRDTYWIGQAAGLAQMIGLTIATLISGYFIIKRKPFGPTYFKTPWKYYIKIMITLGLVASLNHMILLIMQFADAFTLVPGLMEYGHSKIEAMEAKGVFDRGQPLIQLGSVLGSSFALALIPSVSKEKMKENVTHFYDQIHGTLLVSFYLSLGAIVGLIALFPEVNQLLYQNNQGTKELQILSLSILLCSLSITAASILQGFGYIKRTAGFVVIAFFIKWITNQVLVPYLGITGSAAGTVIALFTLFVLVFVELKRKLPALQMLKKINGKTVIFANAAMLLFLCFIRFFFLEFIVTRSDLLIFVGIAVPIGALIYILVLIRGRAFTKGELDMLPFASKFTHIHKERKTNE